MEWGAWFGLGMVLPFLPGFGVPVYRALRYAKTKRATVQSWRSFAWLGSGALVLIKAWGQVGLAHGSFAQPAFFAASLLPVAWASFVIGRGLGTYCV